MDSNKEKAFFVLFSIFIGSLVIASVLASKIISFAGLIIPAGVLAYSITFPITDIVCEIWGRKRANFLVWCGFISLIFVLGLVRLSLIWPSASFWNQQEAFRTIMGSTSRIIIASFIAYIVSQLHDVWSFLMWKSFTGGRHLWLRNNASTWVSQLIDTVIFINIAFYGTAPIGALIKGHYIVKIIISILDTPFVYLGVWLVKKISCKDAEEVHKIVNRT